MVEELDGAIATPERLTVQRMERLAAALRAGLTDVIHAVLKDHRGTSVETQWAALVPVIMESLSDLEEANAAVPAQDGRPRRMLHLKQGVTIAREMKRTGWVLRLAGPEARKGGLIDDVFDLVEKWLQLE